MQRGLVVLAATVAAVLTSAFGVSYATAADASPRAAEVQTITLRGRKGIEGPWQTKLSLKLGRADKPTSFTLCAVIDAKTISPTCRAVPGVKLPSGSRLRLEVRRGTKGAWRLVGVSLEPVLDARLSNAVDGNQFGVVHYRVRLRAPNGVTLRTSNPFLVTWHR